MNGRCGARRAGATRDRRPARPSRPPLAADDPHEISRSRVASLGGARDAHGRSRYRSSAMDQPARPDPWQHVWFDLTTFVPRAGAALVILGAFWLAAHGAVALLRRFGQARLLDPDLTLLLGRAARVALLLVGAITAMGTLGIDVKALVTGLGLTGFALGFALRDIISNALAGVLILLYRPFSHGDSVAVGSASGVVSDIDLRYTTLTVDEHTRVLVPNSTLFTNEIRVERRPPPDAA